MTHRPCVWNSLQFPVFLCVFGFVFSRGQPLGLIALQDTWLSSLGAHFPHLGGTSSLIRMEPLARCTALWADILAAAPGVMRLGSAGVEALQQKKACACPKGWLWTAALSMQWSVFILGKYLNHHHWKIDDYIFLSVCSWIYGNLEWIEYLH